MPKFVITGCGRSGTKWAAQFFTNLGFPCVHEKEPTDGQGISSWMVVPRINSYSCPIIHAVRNPYLVISSLIHRGFLNGTTPDYDQVVYQFRPDIRDESTHLGRVIMYACTWDNLVFSKNILRAGVDSIDHLQRIVHNVTGEKVSPQWINQAVKKTGIVNRSFHNFPHHIIHDHPLGYMVKERIKEWGL